MSSEGGSVLGGRRCLPKGWRRTTLDEIKSSEPGSLAAGPFGSSIGRKYFVDSGVPVIRGNNLTTDLRPFIPEDFVFVSEERTRAKYSRSVVRPGDLVVTCWGTIGQVGLVPVDGPFPEYVISNKQLKARVDPKIADSRFVYYYLASEEGVQFLQSRASGSAVPGINLGVLRSTTIALPSVAVQREVVRVLRSYDDLIENNNRRMELLEQAVHLLFRERFVYLRVPGCQRAEGVDGVPDGWRRRPAGEVIDFNPNTSVTRDVVRPYVPMASLSTTSMRLTDIDERVPKGGAKFRNHDTLLARITPSLENGKTGYVSFLPSDEESATGSTEFIVMRGRGVPPTWVYCLARSAGFRQYAIQNLTGSDGRQRVSKGTLEGLEILVPPEKLLAEWERLATPLFAQVWNLTTENDRLREGRDLLLPRLMDGRIPV